MSNPTNGVWQFDGDAGDWVITGPERYDNGLWLEEATTNLAANPSFETDTTGWAVDFAVLTRQTSWSSEGAASGRLRRNSAVDAIDAYTATAIGTVDPGDSVTYSIDLNASVAMTGLRLAMTFRTAANANISTTNGTLFAGGPGELGRQSLTATAPANSSYVRVLVVHTVIGTIGDDLFMDGVQIEKKAYATSYADNTIGAGYGGSSGAYTRAASSASVTIDEPVSVACWYREGYSGAKQFAYLDTLGQLGDYGDVSWAAGDLTISTSRNLVIGPFAAFDRALTAGEQANLRSTQNWTMNSVNGSNIILPLSGARRRRR